MWAPLGSSSRRDRNGADSLEGEPRSMAQSLPHLCLQGQVSRKGDRKDSAGRIGSLSHPERSAEPQSSLESLPFHAHGKRVTARAAGEVSGREQAEPVPHSSAASRKKKTLTRD